MIAVAAHPEVKPHGGYRVKTVALSSTRRFVAVCTCGWTSTPLPNAGIAGAAWDDHKVKTVLEDVREGTTT